MPEAKPLWSRIPIWIPVGIVAVGIVLGYGEMQWTLQNHIEKDEARQAEQEKLQWKAIGELNRHAYSSEEILRFHEKRIEDLEDR